MATVFARSWRSLILLMLLCSPVPLSAQGASEPVSDGGNYGLRFFEQLRSLFGQFRDADLQHAFQTAGPIPCSELVDEKGEWRPVAFFNDNRKLGDWYRSSLDEVNSDLTVYIFKGECAGSHESVQLTTKFPVAESVDAYNEGKINLKQVAMNSNPPVSAVYDSRIQAYTFELPYMFLLGRENGEGIYTLNPQRLSSRTNFDPDVTDHWECKAMRAADVTYQFLICRTTMLSVDAASRNRRQDTFGASAFFILSDGKEAFSTVKFSFDEAPPPDAADKQPPRTAPETRRPATPAAETPFEGTWESPDYRLAISDVGQGPFRLLFDPDTWRNKIGSAQVMWAENMVSLESASSTGDSDYCIWLPGSGNLTSLLSDDPQKDVSYSVKSNDKGPNATTSIVFDMSSRQGAHLGRLQCYFPRLTSLSTVNFDRWTTIVGSKLKLEVGR